MLIILSAVVLGLSSISLSLAQIPENVSILYGNVHLHDQNQTETLYSQLCGERPIYFDHSPAFNSYVIVCNEKDRVELRSLKIDKNLEREFVQNKLTLMNTPMTVEIAGFALDWIHGLFYFSQASQIFVVDLTKNVKRMSLYKSEIASNNINGIVVRPESSEIYWSEHSHLNRQTCFYKATQSGKNIELVGREPRQHLEQLTFDYVSERFMVLKKAGTSDKKREVCIFEKNDFNVAKHYTTVEYPNEEVRQVRLYNHTLFSAVHIFDKREDPLKTVIRYRDGNSVFQMVSFQPQFTYFGFVHSGHLLRPNFSVRCLSSMCHHDADDFCIANTLDTYVCCHDPDTALFYDPPGHWLAENLVALILIALVILMILVLLIILLFKKRMSFYQIRLRQVKRVNSTKLEPKPDATLEIAE